MITSRTDVRVRVFARDKGICGICGRETEFAGMHLDHIIPICAGGDDDEVNLQVAHSTCNFAKGGEHEGVRPNQRRSLQRGPVKEFLLRLPDDIWASMKEWAEAENRSLNSQIVHVLRRALAERHKPN